MIKLDFNLTKELMDAAAVKITIDTVIKNGNIVDVITKNIYPGGIAIHKGFIVGVGEVSGYKSKETLDVKGQYLVPGFMDAHMHVEPTLLIPRELAKLLIPHGVLTLFADTMEIANVFGVKGIELFLKLADAAPIRILVELPSRVPTAEGLETTGGKLGLDETKQLLKYPEVISLGELNFQNLFTNPDFFVKKIIATREAKKIVNGHAPQLTGKKLNTYIVAGINDDHESISGTEVIEKLRKGLKIFVREGSTERNLEDILTHIKDKINDFRNIMFCTDDKMANDIEREGHIDYNIRKTIELGYDPIVAIQMATINMATNFRLDDLLGSLSVGRIADILVINNLEKVDISTVFYEGSLVYREGTYLARDKHVEIPEWALNSVHVNKDITPEDLLIKTDIQKGKAKVRVIKLIPRQIVNEELIRELPIEKGFILPDIEKDIIHIAVVDRHKATKNIGKGFVNGFGLKRGAIGGTFAHDHHNIILVGSNHRDMYKAIKVLEKMKGGFVVIADNEVIESLQLRLAGLLSLDEAEKVSQKLEKINDAARGLGCTLEAPFMQLQFVSLPSVPKFGITDRGLIDSLEYRIINPVIETKAWKN